MPKLNLYERQVAPNAPRASGEAMGANVFRAGAEMAGQIQDYQTTIQRREDVLDRVRILNKADQTAQSMVDAFSTSGEITNKNSVDQFQKDLRVKMQEFLNEHTGTSLSKAELQAQLENQTGQYVKSVMGAQIKAQHAMLGNLVERTANELSLQAVFAPDKMQDIFAQYDSRLSQLKDGMSAEMYQSYSQAGRAKIAQNAVTSLLQNGNWQEAQKILADPNISQVMDPNAARKLGIDARVDEAKAGQAVQAQAQNRTKWSALLGRNLTAEEQIRVDSLPAKKDMTPADEVVQYELVTGKRADQNVVNQIFNIKSAEGGAFGESLQGRSLNYVTKNADRYAMGLMTRDEALQYQVMANEAYKPTEKQDPVTGQWTRIAPAIPAFVSQSINRGARFYGTAPAQPAAVAPRPQAGPAPAPAPTGGSTTPAQPAAQTAPSQQASQNQSIWSRRRNITGLVPTAMDVAGRVPVVGEAMGGGGQYTTDRQYAEAQSRELIRSLSQSGRYLASEMQAIEKEVSISGSAFDNPQAYARRLIGIDEALAKRVKDETKILANPNTPLEQRKSAESVINVINNFRQTLGVPQRVKSAKEAQKLPPGTEFIDPSGVVRVVPGG